MRFIDGFANFVSRIGTGSDKSTHGQHRVVVPLDLDAAYRTSWLRKICDIPPFDEVREWRTWTGATEDQITKIDAEEKRLGLRQKVAEARTLARKDGGAAIVLGLDDAPGLPLDPERVKVGGLRYLTVFRRDQLKAGERDKDPSSPTFDRPSYYELPGTQVRLHPSRVIVFIGNPIRSTTGEWGDGWCGDSIYVELVEAINHVDQIAAGVASMVDEAKIDVVRINNLAAGLGTTEGENLLVKRWGSMATFKSTNNALLLDKEDEFTQKTLTFAGLPDIQDRALMVMSGMADIPATRMLGRAPQGMNATGDSDMRNYYDRIRAGQIMFLGPALEILDKCLVRSALGITDPEIYYDWNPLYQMSEAEAATVEKTFADTIVAYANAGLIPDTALALMVKDGIIERGQWPGAQQAFDAAEKEGDIAGLLEEPTEAEQAEEQARVAVAMQTANDPAGAAPVRKRLVAANDIRFKDAIPRTLYVRRDILNVAEITKWAKSQGFTDIEPDLHVTIIHSRAPVDWMKMGEPWSSKMELPEGGPRIMENFGPTADTRVLTFAASELKWRHERALDIGASHDWGEYQPHITIQKGGDIDLRKVTPYQGKIVLGPEIFEEVRAD